MKQYYNKTTKKWYYSGNSITHKDEKGLFSGIPTIKQLTDWGFEEYVTPEPQEKELTAEELKALYDAKVNELVRTKYSVSEEFAIQRKMLYLQTQPSTLNDDKADAIVKEFDEYNVFVEECKVKAKEELDK